MGMKSYCKDEKVLWKVYVNLRSKENSAMRIQKSVANIESRSTALRIEKQMITELSRELGIKMRRGLIWKKVLEIWELDAKAELGRRYELTTIQDIAASVNKWTINWMNKPSDDLTRADGKEVVKAIEERLIAKPIPSPFTGLELKKNGR